VDNSTRVFHAVQNHLLVCRRTSMKHWKQSFITQLWGTRGGNNCCLLGSHEIAYRSHCTCSETNSTQLHGQPCYVIQIINKGGKILFNCCSRMTFLVYIGRSGEDVTSSHPVMFNFETTSSLTDLVTSYCYTRGYIGTNFMQLGIHWS